jgi:hypothetical protein
VNVAVHILSKRKCQQCQRIAVLQWLAWGNKPLTVSLCSECFIPVAEQALNRIEEPMKREDKGGI